MQFTTILTLIALMTGSLASAAQTHSKTQVKASADDAIVEMSQAFKQGDRKRLTVLLPQARGHTLEPWAAYWELRARLDVASASEVQAFFSRFAGTYQEDRLRNDWLLVLGQRRDWAAFSAELPHYRMNDDREVRCYALGLDTTRPADEVAQDVKRQWYAQKEADEGCTARGQASGGDHLCRSRQTRG